MDVSIKWAWSHSWLFGVEISTFHIPFQVLFLIPFHSTFLFLHVAIPTSSEKYVGGALFLSLYPASNELLKKLDLTPEGKTVLLKTIKEVRICMYMYMYKACCTCSAINNSIAIH